jgi:hypothetical protein
VWTAVAFSENEHRGPDAFTHSSGTPQRHEGTNGRSIAPSLLPCRNPRLWHQQNVNAEEAGVIEPDLLRDEARPVRDVTELRNRKLVGVFRMYGFAGAEFELAAENRRAVILDAGKMHFDASFCRIIDGTMTKETQVK